jgi:hypothetical protein
MVDFSDPDRTPNYTGAEVIDPAPIFDLTSHLGSDGTLSWDAPQGDWTILRLGHAPTGAGTKHGRPETMGLECDKLSAHASRVQFDNYVGRILTELKGVPGAHLAGVSMDSAEHGSQNWTADFPEQFRRRCGYDLMRYLPAMMGRVVGNAPISDRFLFDVRRTIADLVSEEYFGTFQKLCHAAGMVLTAQAPGIATCLPSDNISAKRRTDIPMGEFWANQPNGTMDCKEAASAAHVYGKKVAAAESFTGSNPDAHPGAWPGIKAIFYIAIVTFIVLYPVLLWSSYYERTDPFLIWLTRVDPQIFAFRGAFHAIFEQSRSSVSRMSLLCPFVSACLGPDAPGYLADVWRRW